MGGCVVVVGRWGLNGVVYGGWVCVCGVGVGVGVCVGVGVGVGVGVCVWGGGCVGVWV